jgi:nicotinate-nucleotide pyrophosphorylase (carboxylating)
MERIWDDLIRTAIKEDMGAGDITSEMLFSHEHRSNAIIFAKKPGILSGLSLARRVFELLDETVEMVAHYEDGDYLEPHESVLDLTGSTRKLLSGERLALNFLMWLSGIATATYEIQSKLQAAGAKVRISETRKTTPVWRFAEKKAVRHGGGLNHRTCLSDSILIKENHLFFCSDQAEAVRRAHAQKRMVDLVEVEVHDPVLIEPFITAGADILMFDNFTPEQVRAGVKQVAGRTLIEVSGGITPDNILDYAIEGVDVISLGYLTHSAPALDFSMEFTGEVTD